MSSMLSSFFSRDPRHTFPYELPAESFTTIQQDIFVGKSVKKNEPQEKATCFWTSSSGPAAGSLASLKVQAQKLKTLRHPNVLTYLDSLEVEGTFYLITEPCRPLPYYLGESRLTDTQRELLVSWGLYQLLNCLKFLHNEANLSHNNLKEAIFVTASGDWKLAAFHLSGSLSSPQADLNDLGSVLVQIFTGSPSSGPAERSASSSAPPPQLPRRLHGLFRRLSARGKAMAVGDILNECRSMGGFMKNKFVDTLLFLEEFQLREAAEKQSFFVHLNASLDLFPEDIARNKILPKLIHTYEYGDAGAHILVPMFKLGRLLEEEEYQQRIVPCLVKLFSSTDRTTRVKLLERIDEFAGHLKPPVVNEKIYANLVTGFMDSNAAVRESTVKAMVVLAEKLNYANLNTDLMKYLAKLQGSDPEPSIRTNTTICLGKIGCFIDPGHRQRILISAFTRALKDPFAPARMAGVIALSASQQYFSLLEVAQKVMPALAPLTVDPEKQVRDHAFKALAGFLDKLQKASDNPALIPELEAQVKAGGRGGLLSGDKVPQWAGWAVKAISGKFYKSSSTPANNGPAKEQQQPAMANASGEKQQTEREGPTKTAEATNPPSIAAIWAGQPTKELLGTRTGSFSSSTHSERSSSSARVASADGWGELLDDDGEGGGGGGGHGKLGLGEESSQEEEGPDDGGGSSDWGERGGKERREDALWSAAMDSWESVGGEISTPSLKPAPAAPVMPTLPSPSKSTGLKLNHSSNLLDPASVQRPTEGAQQQLNKLRQSQSASPAGGSKKTAAGTVGAGKALKLGAVKKQQQQGKQKSSAKDLDILLGIDDDGTKAPVPEGNFATVAKQISQQQQSSPKAEAAKMPVKKVEPKAESSSWQEW